MPRYGQIFRENQEMVEIAKARWTEVTEHLAANGWVTPSRLAVADRYARAYAEYEVLYPVAVEQGPVRLGPNGGDVFNFMWSAVEKLNERLGKLEAKLRIDPAENARAPLKPGPKAKADDYLDD